MPRRRMLAVLAALLIIASAVSAQATPVGLDLERATVVGLQQEMASGRLTSERLTRAYLARIDRLNPTLHAVITVNPDAISIAKQSDRVRRQSGPRGPLEGIPILVKDNIDTADRQPTTAGSTALLGARPVTDAGLVQRLRAAGAVLLGKANLSQWANFRSFRSIDGWSSTGGQTRNPYVLDRSPSGSSGGSAAAVAAGLAAVTIGTETDGSIVGPASANAVVGVKPTRGMVSGTGIVPITTQQDTAGPIARTVLDAALTLGALSGTNHASLADPHALRGKRIGMWRQDTVGQDPRVDRVFTDAVHTVRKLGATVVEVTLDHQDAIAEHEIGAVPTEFKHDINAYLAATPGIQPKTLAALIEFNKQHADVEMPLFGQETFELAEQTTGDLTDPAYREHREQATNLARRSIDDVLARYRLDAIMAPTDHPSTKIGDEDNAGPPYHTSRSPAVAGYPHVSVPAGYAEGHLPIGVSFLGGEFTDTTLLRFAYAFEQATQVRQPPRYLPTLP